MRLPSSHTNLSLILSQDLQLSALLYLDAGLTEKLILASFSFCSFYNVRLLFNAPCSFDRKVIGSEEEEEQIIFSSGPIATHTHTQTYTHTHTNTHLKIVQCKKATELFISSNTLLQIVKSLKNVAYLVFVMI